MDRLLQRLDEIAARLQDDPDALALLALGSVGLDTDRLDEHSDLDFFVIAAGKGRFLEDLDWLGEPLQWCHRNTRDGYKALVGGVFCEFAVFEQHELPGIPFAPGRVVWSRPGFDTGLLAPTVAPRVSSRQWLVDEILSCLYVGLHRWARGEKLAAMRMVQGEALDNLLSLHGPDDLFAPTRRAEQRWDLPWDRLAGGYDATPEAAREILRLLPPEACAPAMVDQIEQLLA